MKRLITAMILAVTVLVFGSSTSAWASYNRTEAKKIEPAEKEYAHPREKAAEMKGSVREVSASDIVVLEKAATTLRETHPELAHDVDDIVNKLVRG